MITESQICEAYDVLEATKNELADQVEVVAYCEQVLENARCKAVLEGKITGSNDAARKAQLQEAIKKESIDLFEAERDKREVQCRYEIAELRVKRYRDLLRLLEINGRT